MTKLPSKAVLEFFYLLFVCLLLHFISSSPFLIYKQLVRQEVFPFVAWNITNCCQSSMRSSQLSNELDRSLFRSLPSRNLTLIPARKEKWFWNKTWTFLVPKYIGTISFVFHFLEQIQRADWGAIVFGFWVDVISNRCPKLPKTRSRHTISSTLKGIKIEYSTKWIFLFPPKWFE